METAINLIRNLVYDDTETFLFQVYNILMKCGFFIGYDWWFGQFAHDLKYYGVVLAKAAIIEFTIDSIALYLAHHSGVERFPKQHAEPIIYAKKDEKNVKNQSTYESSHRPRNDVANYEAKQSAWM